MDPTVIVMGGVPEGDQLIWTTVMASRHCLDMHHDISYHCISTYLPLICDRQSFLL